MPEESRHVTTKPSRAQRSDKRPSQPEQEARAVGTPPGHHDTFRAIAEQASDLIAVTDAAGVITYASAASKALLQCPPEELCGRHFTEFLEGSDAPRALAAFRDGRERGELARNLELTMRRVDGSTFAGELNSSDFPVDGRNGSLVIIRDITERRRAEAALHALKGIIDSNADSLFSVDGNYCYTSFNATHAAVMRALYGVEIQLGDSLLDRLTVEEDRTRAKANLDAVLRGEVVKEETYTGDESMSRRCFAVSHSPILGAQGLVVGVVVSASDITERKQVEEALRESERRLTEAQRLGKIGSWEWIPAEDKVIWSAEMYTIFGIPPGVEDLTPELTMQAIHPEDRAMVMESTRRALEERKPQPIECRIRKPDGTIGHVFGRGEAVLGAEGELVKMTGIYQDVTERRQAEEALRQSEERLRQSQKMEAVGQLAGGIAHDFNNLLTAILGYSELLLASKEFSEPSAREDLEQIERAAERASELTRQILAFSRRQVLRPMALSLNEVLAGMEPLLRRTLGEDIDLVTLAHPHLHLTEVDRHQFEQVLMNLALNARDAMPAGGRLTLETANVELGEDYCQTHPEVTPGSYATLLVSDTGVGMDPHTLARAFEPFFTTKPAGVGTGLGLATVYGIVRQSQGNISVRSKLGEGATFKIYLPRAVQRNTPDEVVIPAHVSARGHEIVMVVEDEDALRRLIERILAGAGYTTVAFGSAHGALAALGKGEWTIDLLLTDVVLPGVMQGHHLAQEVLASQPDIPILYMSGYSRGALVHSGRLKEGVTLLEKPFTPEALTDIVRMVLDRQT
jgi:two-component system cell cycle sensor histidine kinase/response regulator CckA